MKIRFNLEYRTNPNEVLQLCIRNGEQSIEYVDMTTLDGLHWTCELQRQVTTGEYMDYYYQVTDGERVLRHEWLVEPHRLDYVAVNGRQYVAFDHWIDIPEDSYMYSSAFTECVMARKHEPSAKSGFARTVCLKVRAPQLRQDERLAVVGAAEYLGAWNLSRVLPMTEHNYHEWVVSLDADHLPGVFEFKFVSIDAEGVEWETCANRFIDLPSLEKGDVVVYELQQAQFAIAPWKGAGTVIPVFSLRSEGSFGVGDFGDLEKMVDWCAKTRQRVLQILPINDTNMTGSWQESYPYNAISIYALHPQFADFRQLPEIKDEALRAKFEALRQELNALPQIDYERMFRAKMDYLQVIFKQEFSRVKRTKAFKEFVEQNGNWLEPYAQFCVNRDKSGTIDFWHFVQYVLDTQMHRAHAHARSARVILKGDIPIGISRDGVEAWVEPKYFNLNGQAGAPPEAFAEDGQNWGFPTYNWDEMMKDGCQWWVRRFKKSRSISMPTASTMCWASSASGRFPCPTRADSTDSSSRRSP